MKLKILLCSLGLTICSLGIYAQKKQIDWFKFQWEDATLSGKKVEKAAMIVPFEIEGIPHKFNGQFDLGAVSTKNVAQIADTSHCVDTLAISSWGETVEAEITKI